MKIYPRHADNITFVIKSEAKRLNFITEGNRAFRIKTEKKYINQDMCTMLLKIDKLSLAITISRETTVMRIKISHLTYL